MAYNYPTGSHPPPGGQQMQQQGQWGQGPPQQHGGYMQPGQAPPPQSNHYGSYGQQFQQNAYSVNAWEAMQFNTEDEFRYIFENHKSQRYNAIQAEELMKMMNSTARIRDYYRGGKPEFERQVDFHVWLQRPDSPHLASRFNAVQAEELQKIMNDTPSIRSYYRVNWSLELCKIMIAMLDRSKDGMMQYEEFRELLQCLVFWYQTFCQYDQNRSGFIEANEINRCFSQKFGYQVSAKALELILKRYSRAMDDGRLLIAFDDFVSCCVRLRAYTEAFRARDRNVHGGHETGSYEFSYDDFLQCTMCL